MRRFQTSYDKQSKHTWHKTRRNLGESWCPEVSDCGVRLAHGEKSRATALSECGEVSARLVRKTLGADFRRAMSTQRSARV